MSSDTPASLLPRRTLPTHPRWPGERVVGYQDCKVVRPSISAATTLPETPLPYTARGFPFLSLRSRRWADHLPESYKSALEVGASCGRIASHSAVQTLGDFVQEGAQLLDLVVQILNPDYFGYGKRAG